MKKRIVGISPWSPRYGVDYELMKEAGIEWVRQNSAFPFGKDEDDIAPEYIKWFDLYKEAKLAGMKQACVSPIPAGYRYIKETGKRQTYRAIPDWAGDFDSDRFYEVTYRAAKKLAEDTRDYIDLWQVSNEMDIIEFRGDMTIEQAGRYLVAQAMGLREGNPDAMLGINPAHATTKESLYLYKVCYKDNPDLMDYVGVDGYYGSWSPGKVQDWVETIDFLHDLTGKQVLINEWGYPSTGGEPMPDGTPKPCDCGHFRNAWRKGHTEAEQAEYVATGVRLLLTYPNCMGFFYYSWGDDEICWQCGKPNCPSECSWGITDGKNNPKPAYYALKENVLKYNR
jgi:hypothetical protein